MPKPDRRWSKSRDRYRVAMYLSWRTLRMWRDCLAMARELARSEGNGELAKTNRVAARAFRNLRRVLWLQCRAAGLDPAEICAKRGAKRTKEPAPMPEIHRRPRVDDLGGRSRP